MNPIKSYASAVVFLLLNLHALTASAVAPTATGADFTIVVLPDTQYYTSSQGGGTPAMFTAQTDWIKAHRADSNIVYVIHLGDVSDHGDTYESEWSNAANAMYRLESPVSIPYGVAVGNHDQTPNTGYPLSDTTTYFNKYFGVSHFSGRPYYGGHYSGNNDSHYDLFSAGGVNFLAIYIEYDSHDQDTANMNNWAAGLLSTYSTRQAIIVTHYLCDYGNPAPFGAQGQGIYNAVKGKLNVVLMHGGHVAANNGRREDTYIGNTVNSLMADYQGEAEGGGGYMRLYRFSPANNTIQCLTYSPYHNAYKTDAGNQFTLDWGACRTAPNAFKLDIDGDGKSDKAVFRSTNGNWYVSRSSDGVLVTQPCGQQGDIMTPGDYDGDGKTDFSVWRPATARWYVIPSTTGILTSTAYGQSGDIPVVGDFDGDGKADRVVWRPSTGVWHITRSSDGGFYTVQCGQTGDIPAPGDFDGDGRTDVAVRRTSTYRFLWIPSSTGVLNSLAFGNPEDIPVIADYDGDGKADIAVRRASNFTFYWIPSSTGVVNSLGFGNPEDIPIIGDWDHDHKADFAVWRPSEARFYYKYSSNGLIYSNYFGDHGDNPLP